MELLHDPWYNKGKYTGRNTHVFFDRLLKDSGLLESCCDMLCCAVACCAGAVLSCCAVPALHAVLNIL
jgi:hypothetical protein